MKDRAISLATLERSAGTVLRLNLGEYPDNVVVRLDHPSEIVKLLALTSNVSVFIGKHYGRSATLLSSIEMENLLKFLIVDFSALLPSSMLSQLLDLPNAKVMAKVRLALLTSDPKILSKLILDSSVKVRTTLAIGRADTAVLNSLASDPSIEVKRALAANVGTPLPALLKLARDSDSSIHLALAVRCTVSESVLRILAQHASPPVLLQVVAHPYCCDAIIESLADHPYEMVRLAIARKTRAPMGVLQKLVTDPSPQVSTTALNNLTSQT